MSRIAFAAPIVLLLSACAVTPAAQSPVASAASFADATPVEIKLTNFAFQPDDLQLRAGQAYAVSFTNEGFPHDWTAPEFFANAQIAAADTGKVENGMVNVAPGTTVVVHLVPAAGSYQIICAKPGHADRGMTGTISVS